MRHYRNALVRAVTGFVWALASVAAAQATTQTTKAVPGPAVAAGELDPETRVLAREFAIRGAEAFEAGDYEAALANFDRAIAILDVPSIAVMQARTLVKLGRWLEGLDRFQQTARLDLDASAPLPYREAVTQATQEAEVLRKQIPQLALLIATQTDRPKSNAEVTFDGKVVSRALLNISRPVNPGRHRVQGSADGRVYFERVIEMAPGQQLQVHIPSPPVPEPSTLTERKSTSRPLAAGSTPSQRWTSERSRIDWPLYGAAGVAGLGLAGAVTTAVLATNQKATLDNVCDPKNNTCPPHYKDEIGALNTYRTLFFLSTGVAALAGGVATYLWFTAEDDADQLALRVSPGAVTLVGHY